MSTIIAGRFEEEAKARHAPEVLESSGFPAERITTFFVTPAGQPAYVAVDAWENSLGFLSPGSPWVTSNGPDNAIVWVLVANVPRGAPLSDPKTAHPILYALDPFTLKALWTSTPEMLNVGGKYNTPAFGLGRVFVGTDRIQAFGLSGGAPRRGRRGG